MKKILIIFLILSLAAIGVGSVFAMTKEVSLSEPKVIIISIEGDAAIKKIIVKNG